MTTFLLNEPEGFPAEAIERLQSFGIVYRSDSSYPADKITVAFVRLRQKVGREFHKCHPSLCWVVSPTTGVDHLDLPYLDQVGIKVLCLRGQTEFLDHIHATAEHTIGLVLALMRQIPSAVQHVQDGHWNRYLFQGCELHGKTVLILGYGRIGRQVHRLYSAFGCKVIAIDCIENRVPTQLRCDTEYAFRNADILSIHVNLTESTKYLVDSVMLDQLKPAAWLVNTSRGEIIDQVAVIDRVADGRLAGAALDVLLGEPHPLLSESLRSAILACGSRLIITPHIAGFTLESLRLVENFITDLLLEISNSHAI